MMANYGSLERCSQFENEAVDDVSFGSCHSFPYDHEFGTRPPWGWDYVVSFAAPGLESTDRQEGHADRETVLIANRERALVLSQFRCAGFSYSEQWVPANKVVLVRFGMTEEVLMEKSEIIKMELELKPEFGGGFFAFKKDRKSYFVNEIRARQGEPYFYSADRVLIILAVLRSRDSWGANIDVERLIHERKVVQAFALHVIDERDHLVKEALLCEWWNPFRQPPLLKVKRYLGARIALYFAFLAFYARMLCGIGALSIIAYFICRFSSSDLTKYLTSSIFGVCLTFWATYFLEYWKRRNSIVNVQWGLNDFYEDSDQEIRPQFEGVPRQGFYCKGGFVTLDDLAVSPIVHDAENTGSDTLHVSLQSTSSEPNDEKHGDKGMVIIGGGSDEDFALGAVATNRAFDDLPVTPYFSKAQLQSRCHVSAVITVIFSLGIAAATFLILYFKTRIIEMFGEYGFGPFAPGIANGLLISCSDAVWRYSSLVLTKWENHRTIQSHEDSLVTKRFAFQFVSSKLNVYMYSTFHRFILFATFLVLHCISSLRTSHLLPDRG